MDNSGNAKRWRIRIVAAAVAFLWLCTLAGFLYMPGSPYSPLPGDYVAPTKVRTGDMVTVHRHFIATREDTVYVTRTMVRGKCSVSCEIVDLPSSHLLLVPGIYKDVLRDHIIPNAAGPGNWTLEFSIHWQGGFGRQVTMKLPPLEIEVVK